MSFPWKRAEWDPYDVYPMGLYAVSVLSFLKLTVFSEVLTWGLCLTPLLMVAVLTIIIELVERT